MLNGTGGWLVGGLVAMVFSCSSSSSGTGTGGAGGNGAGGSSAGGSGGGSGGGTGGGGGGSDGGPACYHCGAVVLGMLGPSDVCPSSMAVYKAFIDCTCIGKCMTPCSTVCMDPDAGTSNECAGCVFQSGDQGCGDELAACTADN